MQTKNLLGAMFYIWTAGLAKSMVLMLMCCKTTPVLASLNLFLVSGSIAGGAVIWGWSEKYFLLTVLMISTWVLLYSHWYMASEVVDSRFIFTVVVFIFSMLILISSSSLANLILGWDGLGLSSYFLVIYFNNAKSSGSGIITVISNRVGDVFLILAVAGLQSYVFVVLISLYSKESF